MKNSNDTSREPNTASRQGARRGSVYEQIAEARAKRVQVLSKRIGDGVDPATTGTVAALRGMDAPAPVSRKSTSKSARKETPRPEPVPETLASAPEPERSLEDIVIAEASVTSEPRRRKGPLWVISLTIAVLVVGSVAWLSRPARTTVVGVVPAVTVQTDGPEVFANGILSLKAPEAGEALELALASTAWSGLSVVTPDAPVVPGFDSAAAIPTTAVAMTGPVPRPDSLVVAASEFEGVPDALPGADSPAPILEPSAPEAEVVQAPPVALRDIRVVLNAPRTVPDASLAAVIDALEQSGANADPRRVNLTISASNVRYYHPEDAAAAAAIADGIGARLRDFTDFEPTPPEGLVEIWMAGREVATGSNSNGEGPLDQLAQDLRQLQRDLRRALGGN